MASAKVVETSVNTNNSPQDYTTNPDGHSNHNIDSPGFKPFTVILTLVLIHTSVCEPIYKIDNAFIYYNAQGSPFRCNEMQPAINRSPEWL